MIIKNYKKFILNEALAIRKKDTIDPIIDLYLKDKELNKDILDIINKDAEEKISKEASLDKKEAYRKSFQSYILKILKTLSLRIKKEGQILIDTSLEVFNELAPIFIDLNMKKRSFSLKGLESLYSALEGLQFDKKYIEVLNTIIGYFKSDFKGLNEEELIGIFTNFKNLFVSGKELNITIDDKSIPLVNYIGKNEPVWWPYNNGPLEEPLEDWKLYNFIQDLGKKEEFITDKRPIYEIISDRIRDVKNMSSIVYFTNNILPEKFIVSNKQLVDYGKEIDLKKLIYYEDSLNIKERIQLLAPLVQQAEKSVRDIIYTKIRTKRNMSQILSFVQSSLDTDVPSDISPIVTRIEEINRKIGKSSGIDIIYKSEDYKTMIVEVKTYEANFMLNGTKPRGELTLSQHCIATGIGNWNNYVGSEGPNNRNNKYTLQFYIYDLNQRDSNEWVIGISMNKDGITACHTYSDGAFMNLIDKHLKEENIPFYEILNKKDPNDKGTKYEGMTYLEKQIFIKIKQIEINKKIKSGNLTIEEIEEVLVEGADINAYSGVLIRKSINDFERIKYLISKGASIQYLFDEVDNIIKVKNFELLKFLINNGLDLSNYKISSDVVKDYNIFKIITDSWKQDFTIENITSDVFDSITDFRILYLLYSKGYDIKKSIGFDISGKLRNNTFINNNQDNYSIIKFLFDKILPKYSSDNFYNIFPTNINVYHLFILNGYSLNYQDFACLYNISKRYQKDKSLKDILDGMLNSFLTETIIYKISCKTCQGYGSVQGNLCSTCNGSGLSDELGSYKSYIDKESNLFNSLPYNRLLEDKYFSDKFIKVLIKLKTIGVDIDIDLIESYLEDLSDEDNINNKELKNLINLYSTDEFTDEVLSKIKKLGIR